MNWVDWFKSYPITTEQRDLYFMLILITGLFLLFLGPKKADYKNIFLAWVVFVILLGFEVGFIYFLFSFQIFPKTFGLLSLDQIFWMVLAFIGIVVTKKLMISVTKWLKIYKDEH
jgi:hypothetical protein